MTKMMLHDIRVYLKIIPKKFSKLLKLNLSRNNSSNLVRQLVKNIFILVKDFFIYFLKLIWSVNLL